MAPTKESAPAPAITSTAKPRVEKDEVFVLDFEYAVFADAISVCAEIISEAPLIWEHEKGLTAIAMDGSHICMVVLTIPAKLSTQDPANFEIPINMEDLKKILGKFKSDRIVIEYRPQDRKMTLIFTKEGIRQTKKARLSTIDIEYERPNLEQLHNMEFDTKLEFMTTDVKTLLSEAEVFCECSTLGSGKDGFIWKSEGSIGDMEAIFPSEELTLYEHKADTVGTFSNQFLKQMIKAESIVSKTTLQLKTDAPLHAVFTAENGTVLEYYLAPRVEESDADVYEQ